MIVAMWKAIRGIDVRDGQLRAVAAAFTMLAWMLVSIGPAVAELNGGGCDFDGDTYDDLAIGVPGESVGALAGAGAVNVIYGSNQKLTAAGDQLWHQNRPGIRGVAEAGDAFGAAIACGDFDGDGYDDLAVGAPHEGIGDSLPAAGAVNVIYGSAAGLTAADDQLWHQASPGIAGVAEGTDLFGAALATGDLNGDGFDDLAVGAPGEWVGTLRGAGAVNIIYGSPAGLASAGNTVWHQDSAGIGGVSEQDDRFGEALAIGDFDADRYDDLAVGVPGEGIRARGDNRTDAGMVNVLYGGPSGISAAGDQAWHQDSAGVRGAVEAYDLFGHSLAAADFDNDGDDDLAIGAPRESVGDVNRAGAINVLLGSGNGLTAAGNELWHQNSAGIRGVAEAGDLFGLALVAGDFDGDNRHDLGVGVPGESVGDIISAGAINVLYGGASGLTARDQLFHQDSPGIRFDSEAGDAMGSTMGSGDFDNNGSDDVAIGVPGESVGAANVDSGGAVNVIYGGANALTTVDQVWHQDRAGIIGVAEPYDRLSGQATSAGVYQIGYANGTNVFLSRDHYTHTAVTRIDMSGIGDGPFTIVAAADGWIRFIEDENQEPTDLNNYVWIEHANGEWSKYTHIRRNSADDLGLQVGDFVTAGTPLGIEGDVGFASGPHLHFQVSIPADTADPITLSGGFVRGIDLIPLICGIPGNLFISGETHTAASC